MAFPTPRSMAAHISQAFDDLSVHDSPPPSLKTRFEAMQVPAPPQFLASRPLGDGGVERSPPVKLRDPEGTLRNFIEHLKSAENESAEPHLVAIGYELESLLAIYPGGVKLSIQSRPASMDFSDTPFGHGSGYSTPGSTYTPPSSSAAPDIPSPIPEDLVMGSRSRSNRLSAPILEEQYFAPGERIRYEVTLPIWEEGDDLEDLSAAIIPSKAPDLRVLVSLPPTYPTSSPPQLQLLGRYLGSFTIDAGLFGDITRTYISSSGVPFSPGDVNVYEGLLYVQSVSRGWYLKSLRSGAEGEAQREADRRRGREGRAMSDLPDGSFPSSPVTGAAPTFPNADLLPNGHSSGRSLTSAEAELGLKAEVAGAMQRPSPRNTWSYTREPTHTHGPETPLSVLEAENGQISDTPSFTIHVSQPIVDRKSTFIGRAIKVTDEREVPLVIHEILSDKKVAKAAHPAMFAYRIAKDVGGAAGKVYATDCDDDGETAAGSRLAHLLEILEVENVLVVVSRWYGGTLLGADRFKHINQAARDALDIGGFLEVQVAKKAGGGGRRK